MNMTVSAVYVAQNAQGPHVTEVKIRAFGQKMPGWHYGEGVAFDEETSSRAIALHREMTRWGLFTTDAFPGLRGQIVLTAYHSDEYLQLSVEPDGSISYLREHGGKELAEEQGLTDQSAIQAIKDFAEQIWKQSGSSVRSSSTLAEAGSRVARLTTQVEAFGAFLLLTRSASVNKARPFANTSGTTMGKWRVSRRSSGGSLRTYYQMGAS
jgi:hypothetical protein